MANRLNSYLKSAEKAERTKQSEDDLFYGDRGKTKKHAVPLYDKRGRTATPSVLIKRRRICITAIVLAAVMAFLYLPGFFMGESEAEDTPVVADTSAIRLSNSVLRSSPDDDFDGDKLTNGMEMEHQTNPWNKDTDNDGLVDSYEINEAGSDPVRQDNNIIVDMQTKLDKEKGKTMSSPYMVEGVILWADDYVSKARGGIVETKDGSIAGDRTSYHVSGFNGYAQFSKTSGDYAYCVKDGIHTLLPYREEENVWYIQDGQDIEVFDKLPDEALDIMCSARLAQEKGDTSVALSKYSKVCEKFPQTILAPEAYFQSGQILMSRNQFNNAFKSFNAIVKKYNDSQRFSEALQKEFELMKLLRSGERPKYFNTIFGFKDYKSTVGFYKSIVENAPSSDMAPLALMCIGELALSESNYQDAIDTFERIVEDYTYSEHAPDAYFNLGKIYAKLSKSPLYDLWSTKTAIGYFEDFIKLYPSNENVEEARSILNRMREMMANGKVAMGDFYFNSRNNPRAAVIMYKIASKSLPGSDIAKSANEKIKYIREGNLPKKTPVDFLFGRYKRPSDEIPSDEDNANNGIKSSEKDVNGA